MLRNTLLTTVLLLALSFMASAQSLFQVQLAAYAEPQTDFLVDYQKAGLENVEELLDQNGFYRYVITGFKTRLEAEKKLKQVKLLDFPLATIVDLEEQRALCGTPCPFFNGGQIFNADDNEGITVSTIYFGSGRYSLNLDAKMELDRMAFLLEHNRNYNLKILGHSDAQGDAATNMRVSADRARSARNYLISKGISAERLFIKVFGETKPAHRNKNDDNEYIPENQKLNRRVVLAIIDKDTQEVAKDSEIEPTLPAEAEKVESKKKKK